MTDEPTLDLFSIWTPLEAVGLEKGSYKRRSSANGGGGEQQLGRIKGIIGSASKDQHGEVWDPKGADVSYFLSKGWLNYEHKPGPDNVLGHPERVYMTKDANGNAALGMEGVLYLGFPKAKDIWDVACAMDGTGRSLGFSVEGYTTKRVGGRQVMSKGKLSWRGGTLAKSVVLNTAITRQPVNPYTRMDVLAKAHSAGVDLGALPDNAESFLTALYKASVGYQQAAGMGGSMSPLVPQSIDQGVSLAQYGQQIFSGRKITREELALILAKSYPWVNYHQALEFARRIIDGRQSTLTMR
jgi:hypothetical protein